MKSKKRSSNKLTSDNPVVVKIAIVVIIIMAIIAAHKMAKADFPMFQTVIDSARGIQGIPWSSTSPTDNYIPKYNATLDSIMWEIDVSTEGSGTEDTLWVWDGTGYISILNNFIRLRWGAGLNITSADSLGLFDSIIVAINPDSMSHWTKGYDSSQVLDGYATDTESDAARDSALSDIRDTVELALGPFIDSTTTDTIENAHKAVAADSSGVAGAVDWPDLTNTPAGFADGIDNTGTANLEEIFSFFSRIYFDSLIDASGDSIVFQDTAVLSEGEAAAAYEPLDATIMKEGEDADLLDGTAHRIFYTDGVGNVTELPLGTPGQTVKSAGVTSAPYWGADASATFFDSLSTGDTLFYALGGDTLFFYMDTVNDSMKMWASHGTLVLGSDGAIMVVDSMTADSIDVTNLVVNSAYKFPTADGTATYMIITDGAGALSFAAQPTPADSFSSSREVYNEYFDGPDFDTTNIAGDTDVYVVHSDKADTLGTTLHTTSSGGMTTILTTDDSIRIGPVGLAIADSILARLLYLKSEAGATDSIYYFSTGDISDGEHCLYYVTVANGPDSVYWGSCTGGALNDTILGVNEADLLYQPIGHGDADSLRDLRLSAETPANNQFIRYMDSIGALGDSFYYVTLDSTMLPTVNKAERDASGNVITTTYEVQLNNEAGLYGVLSDVANFVQDAEVPGLETDAAHDNFSELAGTVADNQIADGAVDGGTGGEIADGSITNADIHAAAAIAASKLHGDVALESEIGGIIDTLTTDTIPFADSCLMADSAKALAGGFGVATDLECYSSVNVYGLVNQNRWEHRFDLSHLLTADNADSRLTSIPSRMVDSGTCDSATYRLDTTGQTVGVGNWVSDCKSGHDICWAMPSSNFRVHHGDFRFDTLAPVLHASIEYIPGGYRGYRWYLAHTPLYRSCSPVTNENTHVVASNDGVHFDTICYNMPIFVCDSLLIDGGNDTCDGTADGDLFFTRDGTLATVQISKFTYGVNDTAIVVVAHDSADADDSLCHFGDRTFIMRHYGHASAAIMSPSIIFTDSVYKMFAVWGEDSSYAIGIWQATVYDSIRRYWDGGSWFHLESECTGDCDSQSSLGWQYLGTCTTIAGTGLNPPTVDTVGWDTIVPWHIEIIPEDNGNLLMIANFKHMSIETVPVVDTSDTDSTICLFQSTDGGWSWSGADVSVLYKTLSGAGSAFDDRSLYRASAYFIQDGTGDRLGMYYSANDSNFGTVDQFWAIGYTEVEFMDDDIPSDNIDWTNAGDTDVVPLAQINWPMEYFDVFPVHGHAQGGPEDSVMLTLPFWRIEGSSIVGYMALDTAVATAAANQYDTSGWSFTMPYTGKICSLIVTYKGTGNLDGELMNTYCYGPTRVTGPTSFDSLYYTDATDYEASTETRDARLMDGDSARVANGGEVFGWYFQTYMDPTKYVLIKRVQVVLQR